jgi:hypothetical protein
MKWVVLPSDTTDRQVIAIEDCESLSIDLDAMMNPIPMVPATEWREDRHNDVAANESWERSGGVGGIWPRPIDVGGAVIWDVDALWA